MCVVCSKNHAAYEFIIHLVEQVTFALLFHLQIDFRCGDYYGIRLVQQLRSMPDKMKARAEVAVYMQNFDEAEAIYR